MFLRARAHPGLADSLIRYLRDVGSRPVDFLERAYIPRSLGPEKEPVGGAWAGQLSFQDTLASLRDGDILTLGEEVALEEDFREHLSSEEPHTVLAPWLLAEGRSGPDPSGQGDGATADLAHGASWFLDIDPSGPWTRPGGPASPVTRLHEDTGQTLPADTLDDASNWAVFVRWLTYLGLAEERPGLTLDPDPTRAIRWVLPHLLHERMGVDAFLGGLGRQLPVLADGHAERSWRRSTGFQSDSTVKPALAHALLRLQREGDLVMETGRDAREVRTFRFGDYDAALGPEGTIRPATARCAWILPGTAA